MAEQIILTGMVLSAMPIGEFDKRIVLLTKEKGKISVFAKGARRPTSMFIAGSRPFSFGEFTLYKGKSTYNLVSMDITNYFTELTSDFYVTYYGFYFLELSDYFSNENIEGTDTLNLLYYSFKALLKDSIPNQLIRYIFELKLFVINGEYPEVFTCIKCGKQNDYMYFSNKLNGILCEDCKSSEGSVELNPSTIYTMQYIVSTSIDKLFRFTVTDIVLNELAEIMDKFRIRHIDKKIKSLEILEKIL